MYSYSKYLLAFLVLFALTFRSLSQTNGSPQAVVTIVGDVGQTNNSNDFVNTDYNPYAANTSNSPPVYYQQANLNNQQVQDTNSDASASANPDQATIEPTLENGFHVRFQLEETAGTDRVSSSGYMSSGSSSSASPGKVPKHAVTMAERSFNFKKKMRSWLPKRKKKYRPHLCGRF